MEQKRIKVRLTENSPYSDYGYYKKGDIGYIDGYVNDSAVIILENGKFAKADLRWIEVVNEEDKNVNTVLKESEDEKIRKGLIQYFNTFTLDTFAGLEPKKILAWLEKQGEHAKFCDSIQVGDKVTRNQDGVLVNISQLERVSKPADKVVTNLLTVERAKEISPFMRSGFERNPAWSDEDKDILFRTINDLKFLRDTISIDPKYAVNIIDIECEITWLKSLKDRYTWKPSEEQMGVIEAVINNRSFQRRHLDSLYEQLKKLKDEK